MELAAAAEGSSDEDIFGEDDEDGGAFMTPECEDHAGLAAPTSTRAVWRPGCMKAFHASLPHAGHPALRGQPLGSQVPAALGQQAGIYNEYGLGNVRTEAHIARSGRSARGGGHAGRAGMCLLLIMVQLHSERRIRGFCRDQGPRVRRRHERAVRRRLLIGPRPRVLPLRAPMNSPQRARLLLAGGNT